MALKTPKGSFYLQNRFNGLVLQLDSTNKGGNGVCLKEKVDDGCNDQLWYKDGNFIKSQSNNLALTMNPGIAAVGGKLYVACCQWSPYQKWITKRNLQIANLMEQCMVLQTDENSNVKVKLENWKEDTKQLWDFVPLTAENTKKEDRFLSKSTEITEITL